MDNKQLEDEIYNAVHELNQTWIQMRECKHLYSIDPPFDLIDNSFDIIIKLFGNYVWTSVDEERPYVINEETSYAMEGDGEKVYMPMKEYLIKQVDNLEECVNMYKQSLGKTEK